MEWRTGDVIYCDIPYEGTEGYAAAFDHGAFYDWATSRPYPVWVSSYEMPEGFHLAWEGELVCTMAANGNRRKVVERLWCTRPVERVEQLLLPF